MREPSLGLIPSIVTLTPARNTTAAQDAVTVDHFIRQVIAKVPEPLRKRTLLTVKLQNTSISSLGGAYMQPEPAARPARAKVYVLNRGLARNERHISKKPIGVRKPLTLTQRLTRAAILSHVETNDILHSPAISSSRLPLNFVPFQRFATPPSSPRKNRVRSSSGARSHPESSAVVHRDNRRQRLKRIPRQPGSERSGCLPLTFIPLHEAEDAYAAKFS